MSGGRANRIQILQLAVAISDADLRPHALSSQKVSASLQNSTLFCDKHRLSSLLKDARKKPPVERQHLRGVHVHIPPTDVRHSAIRSRLVTLAAAVGLVVPAIAAAVPTTASAAPGERGLTALAQNYLEGRAAKLLTRTTSSPTADPLMSDSLSKRVSSLDRFLEAKRNLLARTGLTYATSKVVTTPISVETAGDRTNLRVHEVTELFPPAGSPEPSTAYSVDRIFSFEPHGATWKLVNQRLAESEGIPPITETPDAPRASAAPGDAAPLVGDPNEFYYGTPTPSHSDSQDDADGDDSQLIIPEDATGEGSAPIGPDKTADDGTGGLSIQSDIPPGLCYTCMRDYAYRYWDVYNPNYRSFSGTGGDCTNFISQIMRRGGWAFDYGWYQSGENWWYNSLNQTYTWAGAENWSWFAPRRTHWLSSVWYMGLADVLQMDFTRNGGMDHTMLMTYRTSSNLYMTYHSTDHRNRPLTEILNAYPYAWYYAYRT